jgi:hypothetical protein
MGHSGHLRLRYSLVTVNTTDFASALYAQGYGSGGVRGARRASAGGYAMIQEHDCIVLTADLPEEGLKAGDVGTVVHVHGQAAAYEVEFVTLTGETVAVATVLPSQLRPVGRHDLSHVRQYVGT